MNFYNLKQKGMFRELKELLNNNKKLEEYTKKFSTKTKNMKIKRI